MSAAALDMDGPELATRVDVPARPLVVKGRLVARTSSQEDPSSDSPSELRGEPELIKRPLSAPKGGRLSELYLRAVEDRKGSSPSHLPSFEPGRPRLMFARVDDPGLRLKRRPHGFELSGRASTPAGRFERRLAVAFEGELFAVIIQAGETIDEIIRNLAHRLNGRYELEVEGSGEGRLLISFREPALAGV